LRLTVNITGIVTKEDTSEGCESAHEVGLEGDRSLDDGDVTVDVRHVDEKLVVVVVCVASEDRGSIAVDETVESEKRERRVVGRVVRKEKRRKE
jgi:hypothetical protein